MQGATRQTLLQDPQVFFLVTAIKKTQQSKTLKNRQWKHNIKDNGKSAKMSSLSENKLRNTVSFLLLHLMAM